MNPMPLGPLMIDVAGLELSDLDRKRLVHPLVGGVILFKRTIHGWLQLSHLVGIALLLLAIPVAFWLTTLQLSLLTTAIVILVGMWEAISLGAKPTVRNKALYRAERDHREQASGVAPSSDL